MGVVLPDRRFVRLQVREWDQKGQKVRGNSSEAALINGLLAKLRHALLDIHQAQWQAYAVPQEQVEAGSLPFNSVPRPTHKSVLYRYNKKRDPWILPVEPFKGVTIGVLWSYVPPKVKGPVVLSSETDVNDAMTAFLLEMRTTGRRNGRGKLAVPSKLLMVRFEAAASLLARYQAIPLPISKITAVWANNFHAWLQTQPGVSTRPGEKTISIGLATRHVRRVRELINWLHAQRGALPYNPLAGLTWANYETKDVEWLDRTQVEALEQMACKGTLAIARWWFLLMAYTGLDYPDAKNYVLNPEEFEIMTPDGLTIQGNRCKPPHVAYCIPRLDRLDKLFAAHPTGARAISPQKLNNIIRDVIAPRLGFEGHLTIKIARKTAGAWFLEAGLNVTEVSKVLGHSKINTTEAHYVKASVQSVRNGMKRTGLISK